MLHFSPLLFLSFIFSGLSVLAADVAMPQLVTVSFDDLVAIRQEVRHGKPEVTPAYEKLIREADKALEATPPSVMDKEKTPPSGDKHDFYAIGNYSWPNPKTLDGLPYIRLDGRRNPAARGGAYDKGAYDANVARINTLCLAWFYSGKEDYAAKAATLLRVWFLDPATRMNPNLNFAAAQPGVHDGIFIGIIEGVILIEMLDHVKLLETSVSWGTDDDIGLKKWFSDFTTWLLESKFGQKEITMRNNHGTWYAAQVAAYSIYSGQPERVKRMIELGKSHIAEQMDADGSMPAELKRTRSLMYSRYALRAFTALARCGDLVGADLWRYQTSDGKSLALSFEFIAPYLSGEKEWAWPQISQEADYPASIQLIRWPARIYKTPELIRASEMLDPIGNETLRASFSERDQENRTIWLLGRNPR